MKNIYTLALAMLGLFAACDEDGDKFTVTGLESSEINVSENAVVLSLDNANANVLTFTWTEGNKLMVNNGTVGSTLGNGNIALQASASEDFASYAEFTSDSYSYAFMGSELNSVAKSLGLPVDVASNLYFRISTSMSQNTQAAYSESVIVKVTPFLIDMSYAKLWNANKTEIVDSLYSENWDGIYEGFLGLSAWQNFWAKEGDGTIWGNIGEDGKTYFISSEATAWNFWAPGNSGCYYTTLNTQKKDVNFKYIQSLSLTGDVNADMTFKNSEKRWSCTFTTEADNASFAINGTTLLYNASTGDTNENAVAGTTAIQLLPDSENTYALGSEASTITIPKAGEYTLYLTINGKNLTMSLTNGSAPAPTIVYTKNVTLYDKANASIIATLTSAVNGDNEYTGVYSGVCTATAWQNFYFKDDNDVTFGHDSSGDQYSISNESSDNCWFPDNNKSYIITLDVPNGKWSLEEITSISISGDFNNWNDKGANPLEFDATSQTWKATNVSMHDGDWGFNFMINLGWTYALKSQVAGSLLLNVGDNIKLGVTTATSYNVTVDLCNLTYNFSIAE